MNTLDTIDTIEIRIQHLNAELEATSASLREAHRIHRAVESVNHLSWDDAMEELNDDPDVCGYEHAQVLLEENRDKPEICGVDMHHLTPAAINAIHDLLEMGMFRSSDKPQVVAHLAASPAPEDLCAVIEERAQLDDWEYAIVTDGQVKLTSEKAA